MEPDEADDGAAMVRALIRWQVAGAAWRVVARRPGSVTVSLLRCDAGEEVERMTSDAPEWLAFLDERDSSEDDS